MSIRLDTGIKGGPARSIHSFIMPRARRAAAAAEQPVSKALTKAARTRYEKNLKKIAKHWKKKQLQKYLMQYKKELKKIMTEAGIYQKDLDPTYKIPKKKKEMN